MLIKTLFYCLVLSHNGIWGNEKSDSVAKSALDLPCVINGFKHQYFLSIISNLILFVLSTWQDDWNGAVANKLHSVMPVLGDWQSSYRRCRKDKLSCVGPHRSYSSDPLIYLE